MRCGIQYVVPPRPGIGDSSGWVYVEADDEYDAIANAIYADVVSTNGNEYKFGEGFASDAFTLSPNSSFGASAADLNWYLNLNNQEGSTDYTGFAKIQVAPVIEGFYVYDANNSADIVSPGDPTTQTFDVIPDSDGDAAVDLNAILSDDSSAVRQDTLWTLSVDHDSEIVASGSLSSDGSDTYIALPSGYTQYTLKYGFDLNGDGDLSNSAEIQRVVTLDIATHAVGNLTAQGIYATAGESFSGAVAGFGGDSTAAAGDYSASITWGDGVITAGTVSGSDGSFEVDGAHTYDSEGSDTLQVSVWVTSQGAGSAASDSATADVRDASLAADWNFSQGVFYTTTSAPDNSGDGNDGTLENDAVFGVGSDGVPALSLDGDGGYVTVDDSEDLDPSTQITVAASINASDWDNADATILQKGGGQYTLSQEDGELVFSVNTTDGLQQVFAPLPSTGAWHTVVGTYDSVAGQISLNIDGTAYSASASGTIVSSSGALTIGGSGDGLATDSFSGMIEEASVYDGVPSLSPALPVEAVFSGVSARAGSTSRMINLSWSLTGVSGDQTFYLYYTPAPETGTATKPRGASIVVIDLGTTGRYSYAYPIKELTPGTTYDFWVAIFPNGPDAAGSLSPAVAGTTSTPALTINGSSSVTTDSTYTLTLDPSVKAGNETISSWTINWGDGTEGDPDIQTFGLDPSTETHAYTTTGTFVISAAAAYPVGTYSAEDTISVTVSPTPTPTPTPAPPTDLTLTPGNTEIALAWDASSGAASYNIYEGTSTGAEVYVYNVDVTSYEAAGLTNGTTYFFYVKAVNSAGQLSLPSAEQYATPSSPTPTPTAPPPPSFSVSQVTDEFAAPSTGAEAEEVDSLDAEYVESSSTPGYPYPMPAYVMKWTNTQITWSPASGLTYNIYRSTASDSRGTLIATGQTGGTYVDSYAVDSTLLPGTTYYYTVTAVNSSMQESGAQAAQEVITPEMINFIDGNDGGFALFGSTSGTTAYGFIQEYGGSYDIQCFQDIDYLPGTDDYITPWLSNWMAQRAPIVLTGFSFGGAIAAEYAANMFSSSYPLAYLGLFSPVPINWESSDDPGGAGPNEPQYITLTNVTNADDWYVPLAAQAEHNVQYEDGSLSDDGNENTPYWTGDADDEIPEASISTSTGTFNNITPTDGPNEWYMHGETVWDPNGTIAPVLKAGISQAYSG